MDLYKFGFDYLREKYTEKLNVIDIGCSYGSLCETYGLTKENSFTIGIDPMNRGSSGLYSHYIECAVDTEEGHKKFYLNSGDPQASSLLELDNSRLTSNPKDKKEKIYIPWADRLKAEESIEVKTIPLSKIINEYFENKIIHFIKIDAEGNDFNIIKSINKEQFKNIIFITAECSSHEDGITMFKNGGHIKEINKFMYENNFDIFKMVNYEFDEKNGTQSADVIYINRDFL